MWLSVAKGLAWVIHILVAVLNLELRYTSSYTVPIIHWEFSLSDFLSLSLYHEFMTFAAIHQFLKVRWNPNKVVFLRLA